MRVLLSPAGGDGWRLQPSPEDGDDDWPAGVAVPTAELPAAVERLEQQLAPRWVWPDTRAVYPRLLLAGVRVARCHDAALVEALLLGHEGRWGEPHALGAAWARLMGVPVPADPPVGPGEPTLFDDWGAPRGAGTPLSGADPLPGSRSDPTPLSEGELAAVHTGQLARISRAKRASPGFGLLVAAESAATLVAAEMSRVGLPWHAPTHDALLAEVLGPRPAYGGGRPRLLQELAGQVATMLGQPQLNPDSQPELLRALRRAGYPLRSTRARELRELDHPVVQPLLRYKELARLHAAHGWAWREQWVSDGRFRPEYVPAGVVSGRWASRGGGALQIPRAVRGAVLAEQGRVLVMADAGQLEPRVLAALSGDRALIAATTEPDLYTALAERAFGSAAARAEAKLGLLSAMYGGGAGSPALAALRSRFPAALRLLEDAARTGQDGGVVRSVLGRTCPPPQPGFLDGPDDAVLARGRARGRFTRNFVVQASAADWANVLLAGLRRRLAGRLDADLVFFQHDEVIVHARADVAGDVGAAIGAAAEEATRLVLGDCGVTVPMQTTVARSYADKG